MLILLSYIEIPFKFRQMLLLNYLIESALYVEVGTKIVNVRHYWIPLGIYTVHPDYRRVHGIIQIVISQVPYMKLINSYHFLRGGLSM